MGKEELPCVGLVASEREKERWKKIDRTGFLDPSLLSLQRVGVGRKAKGERSHLGLFSRFFSWVTLLWLSLLGLGLGRSRLLLLGFKLYRTENCAKALRLVLSCASFKFRSVS